MAFDEHLGGRIANNLRQRGVQFEEKRMFGGMCYLVDDKMCVGVVKEQLMARINPDIAEDEMKRHGAGPMEFTGRPMKGYLFIQPEGLDSEEQLDHWVGLCLDFNPFAKSSKKKK
jgi:TfoX/Sxy family transcriptional regulator of competence genes